MAIVMGTGAFFLALALIVNAVAFLVPYWVERDMSQFSEGLWGRCRCDWYLSNLQEIEDHFASGQGMGFYKIYNNFKPTIRPMSSIVSLALRSHDVRFCNVPWPTYRVSALL